MKEQLEIGDIVRRVVFSNIAIDVIINKITAKFAFGNSAGTYSSQILKFSRNINLDGAVKYYGAQKYDTPYRYIEQTTNKEQN